MQALYKLSYFKFKSKIRNIFSKPLSAILTSLAILFYGGTAVVMLFIPSDAIETVMSFDSFNINLAILLLVAVIAFMTFSMLITKNKALFYREDAYYLFTSPFSFKQIINYLLINNGLQALMISGFILYMGVILSIGLFSVAFLLIAFVFITIIQLFILLLIDYFYLQELINPKNKPLKWIFMAVIGLLIVAMVGGYIITTGFDVVEGLKAFVISDWFHFVPIFGWLKYALLSIYIGNYLVGFAILCVFILLVVIVYNLLVHVKGDFFAEALEDAEKMTEYLNASRKGKILKRNAKVYEAKSSFKPGEYAIFSKNVLLMKKGRDFLKGQDFLIIFFYLALAYFLIGQYTWYSTMMLVWVMMNVMQSSINDELKNFYIYLIPGNPYKKMLATVLPLLLKPIVLICFAYLIGAIAFWENPITVLATVIQNIGIMFMMVAGSVLAVRIMKSQTNVFVENLLRMLVMIIAFIPVAIVVGILALLLGLDTLMIILPYVLFIINTIFALGILFLCAPMLNGTEISLSEEQ